MLVTGAAGFIGSFLCQKLLRDGESVIVGFDNLNHYYDVDIKKERLKAIGRCASAHNFSFIEGDLVDASLVQHLFEQNDFDIVVNLAAQAGVRYSIENPKSYIDSNIVGFFNILEACRHYPVRHLVYASSSSVYGGSTSVPFSEGNRVDSPVSLYAATKMSNELMASAYSKLYSIPATGLRFFTVYGPMGRPDMAYFSFTDRLVRGETIKVFNMGNCERDFTYIDDVTEGICRVLDAPPKVHIGEDGLPNAAHRIYNIGNSNPENLLVFLDTLCRVLREEGVLPESFQLADCCELVPMQPGDVPVTFADTAALEHDVGFKPCTKLEDGLREFARWYREFYGIRC